jgi:hypothetical protein
VIAKHPVTIADRLHAVWMILIAVLVAAYWGTYFLSGATQIRADAVYIGFENAFPLADSWMAIAFLLAARSLWRGDETAVLWGCCAGSAMIFLGCMDLLFNVTQGNFSLAPTPALLAEMLIVAVCLVYGPFAIHYCWRKRRR